MIPKITIIGNANGETESTGKMVMLASNSKPKFSHEPLRNTSNLKTFYEGTNLKRTNTKNITTKRNQSTSNYYATSMFPGPKARACLELAQQAVEAVEAHYDTKSSDMSSSEYIPITDYVHRPMYRQGKGKEQWIVTQETQFPVLTNCSIDPHISSKDRPILWKITRMHVDCGGFVRNVLCSVLQCEEFVYTRSDRDYMRAKDFYTWISSLPMLTTKMLEGLNQKKSKNDENKNDYDANNHHSSLSTTSFWRRVHDLRYVLPGDILAYRRAGNAVGGAAFTTADSYDLKTLLRAVRMAQLYKKKMKENDTLSNSVFPCTKNFARDTSLDGWINSFIEILENHFGITNVTHLNERSMDGRLPNQTPFWTDLRKHLDDSFDTDTIELLQEAVSATEVNTGHVVFVAGSAKLIRTTDIGEEYRIPIFHSTERGRKNNQGGGVERNFRRVIRIHDTNQWIRPKSRNKSDLVFLDVAVGRLCA
jgi:hypothetical protein